MTNHIPKTIHPLVRRHAEDAAFYWAQHDASAASPFMTLAGLARFDSLLDAHLEGLEIAGPHGFSPSLAALQRWKKPSEAFVVAYTALTANDDSHLIALIAELRARPHDLLRGVISAIAWLDPRHSSTLLRRWTQTGSDAIRRVAALRAIAMSDIAALECFDERISNFLESSDEHVRSAACRVAAAMRGTDLMKTEMSALLKDPSITVRAEAAIAFCSYHWPSDELYSETYNEGPDTLLACINDQLIILSKATGWYRQQALRRLDRWVRHLAEVVVVGNKEIPTLLIKMPPRMSLIFCACHGDPKYLPFVVDQMASPETARLAGWTWQTMTGVDLIAAGLSLSEPELMSTGITHPNAGGETDVGLPQPDVDAIRRYPSLNLRDGKRYLLGQPLTPLQALNVFETSMQLQRGIAARYLQRRFTDIKFSTRAPVAKQFDSLYRARHQLTVEESN
ncbi:hypothetical protein [Massilia pseudoviolaceinigra]|uniref:hypothetical protein n=1 Tax=Massilia pseudoviolaceinigra TaxID=3057165 RepID=UPI0027969EC9|nr:hypothetical protein [Massilia sp. CCM 9206]MDQ1918739.1 hypothetical protein [Massilia sp. CCM 9206]